MKTREAEGARLAAKESVTVGSIYCPCDSLETVTLWCAQSSTERYEWAGDFDEKTWTESVEKAGEG